MRTFALGKFLGLETTISLVGIVCFVLTVPPMAWLAAGLLHLGLGQAWVAALLSAPLMFLSEWIHQWGHARAARRTGYPMTGMCFNTLFAISIYPPDEPELPAALHIRRALGGFWVNMLLGAALASAALFLWPRGGVPAWLAAWIAVWNFFVVGLGALVPIDIPGKFTDDGGTLLRYWRKR